MNEVVLKITPVILIFILGYVLKRINLLKKEDGDLLLKIVFYISLPALIFLSVTSINLSFEFIYLPIIAVLIIFITFFVSLVYGRMILHLPNFSLGVFLIGSMIMNIGFNLPFFIAAYGEEGLARASIFDFGNAFLVLTFIYYLACRYGNQKSNFKMMVKKFILLPPIWALIISIMFNLTGVQTPNLIGNFFHMIGNLTIPLIMLSLGIYFNVKIVKFPALSSAIVIRMLFGLLLGFTFSKIFALEGMNRLIVIIAAAAPVGYNTLVFASLENLDKEFAASLVSFSILIGIFFIPFLILVLS